MKIACDAGISGAAIDILQAQGHEVVFWAGHEPDEWWFPEAIQKGAELFVTHDWDILLMADEANKHRVRIRQGLRGKDQAHPVLRAIERMQQVKHG